MITLEQVSKVIIEIINKHIPKLKEKYTNVELSSSEQGVFLTCSMKNNEKITLRVVKDLDRLKFNPSRNSKEHQEHGGHKAEIEKINRANPNAWKIEVKLTIKHQIMEIAFSGNEAHWNPDSFESDFVRTILNR